MTTEVNVHSYTQRLVVEPSTKSVAVIHAGPRGPSSGGPGHVEITGDTMTGPLILSGDATDDLGAVTKQQLDAAVAGSGGGGDETPTGTFIMGGWETDPAGYLILDGSTVVGGAITYADLASAFPSWVSGSDLILPNADECVPLGTSTVAGLVSGSMSRNLTESQLPAHNHAETPHTHTTPNHSHTNNHDHAAFTTASGGAHRHDTDKLDNANNSGSNTYLRPYSLSGTRITATYNDGQHTHSINVPSYSGSTGNASPTTNSNAASNTGDTGSGAPIDITPKHLTVRFAVKT